MVAKSLHHKKVSQISDAADISIVRRSEWNADHDLSLGSRDVAVNDAISEQDHLSIVRYDTTSHTWLQTPTNVVLPANLPPGFKVKLLNLSASAMAGIVTVTPESTINGSSAPRHLRWEPERTSYLELLRTDTNDFIGMPFVPLSGTGAVGGEGGQQLVYDASRDRLNFIGTFFKHRGKVRPMPTDGSPFGFEGVMVNGVYTAALAPQTLYYVCYREFNPDSASVSGNYVPAVGATHGPSTTPGNEGVEIVNGDDNQGLIGLIRTDASGRFRDDPQARFVASWFNRPPRSLSSAYMNGVQTSSVAAWDPGVSYCSFVSFGDPVFVMISGGLTINNSPGPQTNYMTIGMNGGPLSVAGGQACDVPGTAAYHVSTLVNFIPDPGYHYLHPMLSVTAGIGTFYGQLSGMVF